MKIKNGGGEMAHKYAEYLDDFHRTVQRENDRLAKLPEAEHMEIVLDSDATEQEVYEYLHGELVKDDM